MQSTEESLRQQANNREVEHAGNIELEGEGGVDFLAAIWRYKFAVFSPALLGLVIGAILWMRLPETYESSARMLVESDQPMIFDSKGGGVINGLPNSEVIQAQLLSDKVLSDAAARLRVSEADLSDGLETPSEVIDREFRGSLAYFVSKNLNFLSETDDNSKSSSIAFRLAIRHTNRDLTELSVKALHDALQAYFEDKREGAIGELKKLISRALSQQVPEVERLEEEYRKFRSKTDLQWDSNGIAINPHRAEQNRLKQKLAEVQLEYDSASVELELIQTMVQGAADPRTAIETIGQMLGKELITPSIRRRAFAPGAEDFDLKRLGFDEQLVPLIVERQKIVGQVGENHPSVKDLDAQIKYSKEQFEKLSREFTDRIAQLLDNSETEKEEAEVAAITVIATLGSKRELLARQLQSISAEINRLKAPADALAAAEQENEAWRRKLDRATMLLSQLEEQMARISLSDSQAGVELSSLTAPTSARVVGPSAFKCFGGGFFLGLLLGGVLAYVLEGQAGTFRSAQEIESTLQTTIFSHIPYDPGRRRRLKKGEEDPLAALDDKLSVVHRPQSLPAEAIRACRTNIFFETALAGAKIIQVTSPLPSDGKSTIAGNLAASIAQTGKSVVVVDADLRRPQISENLGIQDEEGLTSILNGDCEPSDAIHATLVENLFVVPSGPLPLNPAEALTLVEMQELLQWLRERYDYVIVDTPPLLAVTDPSIVAGIVDCVLLTLKVRRKSRSNAKEAVSILRSVRAKVLGVVINASDDQAGSDGYQGYGYYKYSRYASKYHNGAYGGGTYGKTSRGKNAKPALVVSGRGQVRGVTSAEFAERPRRPSE